MKINEKEINELAKEVVNKAQKEFNLPAPQIVFYETETMLRIFTCSDDCDCGHFHNGFSQEIPKNKFPDIAKLREMALLGFQVIQGQRSVLH